MLFSRKSLPLINICRCPPGVGVRTPFPILVFQVHLRQHVYSQCLPPLGFSCLSFSSSLSCFQQLADSFCKMPGGGVPLPDSARIPPFNSGDQDLQLVYAVGEPLWTCQPSATVLNPTDIAMTTSKTLYQKIWDSHVVHEEPGQPAIIYIDRHLIPKALPRKLSPACAPKAAKSAARSHFRGHGYSVPTKIAPCLSSTPMPAPI